MIEAKNIFKAYAKHVVIDNFNIQINDGDFICITGESGKGKTTLLNILSLLEPPSKGDIIINNIKNPNKKQMMLLRRNILGNLFQNYALIENETVEENLNIALEYRKNINKNKKQLISNALEQVNLKGYSKRKIYELSGGEQQKVAIARLVLQDCNYIFADEPTGNLDKKNRDIIFKLLKNLNDLGKTIVYVSHDQELVRQAGFVIEL